MLTPTSLSKVLKTSLAGLSLSILVAASAVPASATNFVVIRGGATAGSWYAASALMAKIMGEAIEGYNVTTTAGSADLSITEVNDGAAQYAFTMGPSAAVAVQGEGQFDKPHENVRAVMAFFPLTLQVVASRDSDIETFSDLAGKRISAGQRGFTSLNLVENLTTLAEIKDSTEFVLLNYGDAHQQFQDHMLDAVAALTGTPNPSFTELNSVRPLKLVPLGDELIEKFSTINAGYVRDTVPGGIYSGWDEDASTLSAWTVIITSAERSDDEVYQFVKALYEQREEFWKVNPIYKSFDGPNVTTGVAIPFHPGAERYWKEIGVMQ